MRYIDADLIEYEEMLCSRGNGMYVDCEIAYKDVIDVIPTADVRENVKGEWIVESVDLFHGEEVGESYICSVCGKDAFDKFDFCPNCGAQMEK